MKTADAVVMLAILAIVLVAWFARSRRQNKFCSGAGPGNIGLYDWPQKNYPRDEGRRATRWDSEKACVAYCAQPPCAVWCR